MKDHVAVELPLEVRLNGAPFSVIMRTPGSDRELALGFLFAEGIIRRRDDVERIDLDDAEDIVNVVFVAIARRCRRRGAGGAAAGHDELVVRHVRAANPGIAGRRRAALPRSSGRSIARRSAALAGGAPRGPAGVRADRRPSRGGLLRPRRPLEASAEDVGRHNAVDKVLGRMLEAAVCRFAGRC